MVGFYPIDSEPAGASAGVPAGGFTAVFATGLIIIMGRELEHHYDLETVAQRLGLGKSTVRALIRTKKIAPVQKLGHRTVRIPQSAMDRYLKLTAVTEVNDE